MAFRIICAKLIEIGIYHRSLLCVLGVFLGLRCGDALERWGEGVLVGNEDKWGSLLLEMRSRVNLLR